MEYCNEGTLESLILNKRHEMTEETVMKLLTQIVIALKFLQDKKIIHRDIKPKNILLHNGKVKIADFGVAKMIDKHK
jgi:serine/threonine protein kinase